MPRPLVVLLVLALGGCAESARLDAEADRAEADRAEVALAPVEARTVHLSGRFVTGYGDRPKRGVYGLRVRLLFRRADGSGWDGAAPPPGPDRRHRTFDVLGEDGRFRFDLATALDLSAYDEVAVVPETVTRTVRLVPPPRGSRRFGTGDDAVTVLPLADAIRVPLPPSGPVVADGLEAEVRREVGVTVRWSELSRAFVEARYAGEVPFELPRVRVELSQGGGFVFQALDPDVLALGGHEIELNAARGITPTLVAHEYGHYTTFRMWGASPLRYTLRNRNLREGWAIFFSFAVRSWAAATYGDVDLAPSNPERAPFTHRIGEGRRYRNIAYGTSHPDYSAIGALLWSLYDVADPSPFEYEGLDLGSLAGDNDDIAGGLAVFEAVRLPKTRFYDEVGIDEVVDAFRQSQPAALAPSVDGAVDFFLCPAWPACDVVAAPDASPSTALVTLRPVPPANLVAERVSPEAVALRWDRRVGSAPWANPPEAYHVVRDGALVATLPGTASAWIDAEAGRAAHRYEVRAVGGGGEAFGAPSAEAPAASGPSSR
ncbi:hypothetical protein [Rubrivirga marina]|uniref:Uncharacterized protein n=1 Tax=Rubrivirga marina TaxID=1196024 RepID=A0A271IY26_9BACT|nr:hypothetical protein [Rubrivirga marina]PAP76123.1 hypothetical protein BSZ37_06515 [Rubrivirga marina]